MSEGDGGAPPLEEAAQDGRLGPLGIRTILATLPHRYPFLLVDRILEFVPGRRAVGLKNVTFNEEFFQGHFPGNPVMPGVLIVEAMAQLGGFLIQFKSVREGQVVYLAGIDKARFRRPVVPGDQLVLSTDFLWMKQGVVRVKGEARVDGHLCAEAELMSRIGAAPPEGL